MKENRRDFIKKTGVSLAAVSVGSIGSALAANPREADPGKNVSGDALQVLANESKMRITVQASTEATPAQVNFYKQAGVNHVLLSADEAKITPEYYTERKKFFANTSLEVYGINDNALLNDEKIILNMPGRDDRIELYKQHLRALNKAAIYYTTYAHMGNGVWNSANGTARADAIARTYDPKGESWGQWGDKKYTGPLSHGREYTPKEMWANFEYFIRAVAPVAQESNVSIGIMTDYPPTAKIAGVPRLFSTFADCQRALALAKSANVGLSLDIGAWAAGGTYTGKDSFAMIDYFGKQKKLLEVRASNVSGSSGFTETFVDSGAVDMYKVMKALRKVDFDGIMIADHIPQMVAANMGRRSDGAYDPSLAWTLGYTKCLRDRVEEEAVI